MTHTGIDGAGGHPCITYAISFGHHSDIHSLISES